MESLGRRSTLTLTLLVTFLAAPPRRAEASDACERLDPATEDEKLWDLDAEDNFHLSVLGPQIDSVVQCAGSMDDPGRFDAERQLESYAPEMIPRLCHVDPRVRYAAVYVISKTRFIAARPYLFELVHRETYAPIMIQALNAIGPQGEEKAKDLVPLLRELLECQSDGVRKCAENLAYRIPDRSLADPLLRAWSRTDEPGERYSIMAALGATGDRRALDVGLEALAAGVPASSALIVAERGDLARIVDVSERWFDTWTPWTQQTMCDFVEKLGGEDSVPFLSWAFARETDEQVRRVIATDIVKALAHTDFVPARKAEPLAIEDIERVLDPCNADFIRTASMYGTQLGNVLPMENVAKEPPGVRLAIWSRLLAMVDPRSSHREGILWWLAEASGEMQDFDAAFRYLDEATFVAHERGWDNEVLRIAKRVDELRLLDRHVRGKEALRAEVFGVDAGEIVLRLTNMTAGPVVLPPLDGEKALVLADVQIGETVETVAVRPEGAPVAKSIGPQASVDFTLRAEPGLLVPSGASVQVRLLAFPSAGNETWVGVVTTEPFSKLPGDGPMHGDGPLGRHAPGDEAHP